MTVERTESGLEAKGMWFNSDRIAEMWKFSGVPERTDLTEEQAKKHLSEFLKGNEFATNNDLELMGFMKRETAE
jgi:hypothetical protein